MTWAMYAHDRATFEHVTKRAEMTRLYGDGHIVPVNVEESGDPTHWGWLETGADFPVMIYPSEAQAEMCHPYGSAAATAAGQGRMIRLSIARAI